MKKKCYSNITLSIYLKMLHSPEYWITPYHPADARNEITVANNIEPCIILGKALIT